MMTQIKTTTLLVAGCLFGGCAAPPTEIATATQAIALEQLPELPGCEAARGTVSRAVGQAHPMTLRAVAGTSDLYVLYDGAEPLCVDSGNGLAALDLGLHAGAAASGVGDSNPMPGAPTPGQPVDPAHSNPMPGSPGDPAASNPMPGTDNPGSSNPMPGRPTYGQGYTTSGTNH